jgi:hypothetical protein
LFFTRDFLMRALALCLLTLASPSFATTVDELRAMVWAGDIQGVKAAMVAAETDDKATKDEPEASRTLNAVFLETHPKVDAFTKAWLAKEPNSANAMVARGFHIYAYGLALRRDST